MVVLYSSFVQAIKYASSITLIILNLYVIVDMHAHVWVCVHVATVCGKENRSAEINIYVGSV